MFYNPKQGPTLKDQSKASHRWTVQQGPAVIRPIYGQAGCTEVDPVGSFKYN